MDMYTSDTAVVCYVGPVYVPMLPMTSWYVYAYAYVYGLAYVSGYTRRYVAVDGYMYAGVSHSTYM